MSNEKMSADDLIAEIERIESTMEYTSATIAPCNLIQGARADWREVHKGRAYSSYNQLRNRINTIPTLRAAVADLIAERDGLRAARIAYASEFPDDAEGMPNVGSIHENIRKLKAERDALRDVLERIEMR